MQDARRQIAEEFSWVIDPEIDYGSDVNDERSVFDLSVQAKSLGKIVHQSCNKDETLLPGVLNSDPQHLLKSTSKLQKEHEILKPPLLDQEPAQMNIGYPTKA